MECIEQSSALTYSLHQVDADGIQLSGKFVELLNLFLTQDQRTTLLTTEFCFNELFRILGLPRIYRFLKKQLTSIEVVKIPEMTNDFSSILNLARDETNKKGFF